MASFKAELPTDLMDEFKKLDTDLDSMFEEMVDAGTDIIYNNIKKNMNRSFETTKSLEKGLKKARPKKLRKNDGYGAWAGFEGYTSDGTPIPLIAMAREYGTSRGERKKPFVRNAVNKSEIESAMMQVQKKYIKEN